MQLDEKDLVKIESNRSGLTHYGKPKHTPMKHWSDYDKIEVLNPPMAGHWE